MISKTLEKQAKELAAKYWDGDIEDVQSEYIHGGRNDYIEECWELFLADIHEGKDNEHIQD